MNASEWINQYCDFRSPFSKGRSETRIQAAEAKAIFASLSKMTKTANVQLRQDINFFVDPELASKYNINLHLTEKDARNQAVTAKTGFSDLAEETVNFPSKKKSDSEYSCNVVMQKPDNEVFAVSVYMTEEYLGRYVHKSNFYFKKSSRNKARRCYERVLRVVQDLRDEFIENPLNQSEIPHHLKRALQGEVGEIEPKSNKVATFLDPSNVAKSTTIGSENILTIPTHRSITEDLEME